MAIQFARARYISRSSGGSAVRSAAYNARDAIKAERTGELYWFQNRDAPEHHEVLLPEGAAERVGEAAALWNAAEAAERRKDAQVAREIVLALPANRELGIEDRIALARSFAIEHFVAKGLAVQLDVHAPHGAEAEGERANWHAHLLITTRRVEGGHFAAKKARDLDPEVRSSKGRARVADGAAWGELWREHQDRYFREHGLEIRVDVLAPNIQEHVGPVRMRRVGSEIVVHAEAIKRANQEAARDPKQVLAALTRHNATFTMRDVDRFLAKHLAPDEAKKVHWAITKSGLLVGLCDPEKGTPVFRYTTEEVRAEERAAMAAAGDLAQRKGGAASPTSAQAVVMERPLRPDQEAAFIHAIGARHLALIEGRAGTGKSYTLTAIREAYEGGGARVIGLAPTNTVAQDMAQSGFAEARTVHAALFALKNGRDAWDKKTVLILDEAAMLDTKITGALLATARGAGAKVILAGDDHQLASIERGGLFTELRKQHGSAVLREVLRQKADWQRQAAQDLAEGRFNEAVEAFDEAGAIVWSQTQGEAHAALIEAWTQDGLTHPGKTRFVFAYTNLAVDSLNAQLREVCRAQGQLTGEDVAFETKHGKAAFAVGDRVQFTATEKRLGIYNGNAGTIVRIEGATITARLDAAGKPGREVVWDAGTFDGFRHGYAGTIYKGQGKTLDRTYLYHTENWHSAASYVALTRQRESAQLFVARNTAPDVHVLARQMARGEVRAASIAWLTHDEARRMLEQRRLAKEAAAEAAAEKVVPWWMREEVARRREWEERNKSAGQREEAERQAGATRTEREKPEGGARAEQASLEGTKQTERGASTGEERAAPESAKQSERTEPAEKEQRASERSIAAARLGRMDHPAQAAPPAPGRAGAAISSTKEGVRQAGRERQAERPAGETQRREPERQAGRGETQEHRGSLDEALERQRAELARMRALLRKSRRVEDDPLRAKVRAALEARREKERQDADRAATGQGRERQEDAGRAAAERGRERQEGQPRQEWLVPPHMSWNGRDSLGRGLDAASITQVVVADAHREEAKAQLAGELERAYRDPGAAGKRLNALVNTEGWKAAAEQLTATPEVLGELRGKDGFFAFRAAREKRAQALAAVRGARVSLDAIAEAGKRAEKAYRESVAAQLARDEVGIPKLSAKTAAALEAVQSAIERERAAIQDYWKERVARGLGRPAVAQAWAEKCRDPAIAAEITRFRQAAELRLGPDGLAAAERNARDGTVFSVPEAKLEPRVLREVARRLAAAREGPDDYKNRLATEARENEERQSQRYGRGRGMHL